MQKFLCRVRSQSAAIAIWRSKAFDSGQNNVAGGVRATRTFTMSNEFPREPVTSSMQEQIVNELRLGERSRASSLLSELGHRSYTLRADDFVYILQYCSTSPDPLFVMETLKLMEEKEIDMNDKCYYLTVKALCRGGYLNEALKLLSIIGENTHSHMLPIYNNFLGACVQMPSLNYANECLDMMEHQMVGKNEVTYLELMKLAVLQQNLSGVYEIWKECLKYYSVSVLSLRQFIRSFTRLKDLESAYLALQYMVALAFQENFSLKKTAEGKLSSSRLDIPVPTQCDASLNRSMNSQFVLPSVLEYRKEMETHATSNIKDGSNAETETVFGSAINVLGRPPSSPIAKVLQRSFSDVIHSCANMRNHLLAEQLMLQMQNLGLEPSPRTYDGFIRSVLFAKGLHDGMEVLNVMQHKKIKPCNSTLAVMSVSCSRNLELDLAQAFLDRISEIRSSLPFNAFFQACDTLDCPELAVRMLAKMKQLNVHPDIRTYELLFSLFGNVNAPYEDGNMLSQVDVAKRINTIEMDMMKNGIQHSRISMKNLLKALGAEGMTKELIQYLHVAENQFSSHNKYVGTTIYNTVLHSLVEAKESHMAIEIFKTMISCGIAPDAATYNIMIDCCNIIKCLESACSLVSLMIRTGFSPGSVTYTSLIKILLGSEDLDEALRLLGSAEGIEADVLLYNTVLQAACEKGRIDVIELVVEQMHQRGVHPDPSTCSYVFAAYVDQGFYNTAMEALQVLSLRMISEEDELLERRAEFEDLILSEELEAESQILEGFRESEENLVVALLNLRWCSTLGFPISWLPNQSGWAKRLLRNYVYRRNLS